ncbi:MAG: hypothetical protein M1828_005798 [Chrysothrix sp. TS-e1954]|nr:MAG: hypothetical protein M1828_005798 [Chrysothrix sp. TS-e1954]
MSRDIAHYPRLSESLPPFIFGTGAFNAQHNEDPFSIDSNALIERAFKLGVRAFDTSPYYGPAEDFLGKAFEQPAIRESFKREDYYILTKCGRIGEAAFDYSPAWIRQSVKRSLSRLGTSYLDLVYCHDIEYVSAEETLEAVKELRRMRDEDGSVRHIGISGLPLDIISGLAERVLQETGEPLDAVMSYAHFTLQNTKLNSDAGLGRLKAAKVDVVPNASPLALGLLRSQGPPVEGSDFHPASQDLRRRLREAGELCAKEANGAKLEDIALWFAFEGWLRAGRDVGSSSNPTLGEDRKHARDTAEELQGLRLGVSVVGMKNVNELESAVETWTSVLDSVARVDRDRSIQALTKRQTVGQLVEKIWDILGPTFDVMWQSPPPGYVNNRTTAGKSDS